MITKEAITLFKYYLQSNHKPRTIESYRLLLERFEVIYAQKDLETIALDEIFHFLENLTGSMEKSTRRLRYARLKAFYNFIMDRCSLNMRNPCSTSLLGKSFKAPKQQPHKIPDRETVDEMIYNTKRQRDRLIRELQARCGLRIGELLKIKGSDVKKKAINGEDRMFPICYSTARSLTKRLGTKLNVRVAPHDLWRYSATYAGRNGVPLEVVLKVILRYQDLKTTGLSRENQ